jgi:hypothetical protein
MTRAWRPRENPFATSVGDHRYDDKFHRSCPRRGTARQRLRGFQKRLQAIDRTKLNDAGINYDIRAQP